MSWNEKVVKKGAAQWWTGFSHTASELAGVAMRLASITASTAAAERVWKTYSNVHTKTRNRLGDEKTQKLVFLKGMLDALGELPNSVVKSYMQRT